MAIPPEDINYNTEFDANNEFGVSDSGNWTDTVDDIVNTGDKVIDFIDRIFQRTSPQDPGYYPMPQNQNLIMYAIIGVVLIALVIWLVKK